MAYMLSVYFEKYLYRLNLSQSETVTVGGDKSDSVFVRNSKLKKGSFVFKLEKGDYRISGKGILAREDRRFVPNKNPDIAENRIYSCNDDTGVLVCIHPLRNSIAEYVITAEKPLLVGRKRDNDVLLADKRVSLNHCRVFKNGNGCFIEDSGSTNGTYVNGKRITEAVLLCDGDVVSVGIYQISYRAGRIVVFNADPENSETVLLNSTTQARHAFAK